MQGIIRERCPDVSVEEVLAGSISPNHRTTTLYRSQSDTRTTSSGLLPQNTSALPNLLNHRTNTDVDAREHDSGQETPLHEIGLIPFSSGASKYVGPSSGFSFAKLVFAKASRAGDSPDTFRSSASTESPSTMKSSALFKVAPTPIPETAEEALQLSRTYFEHVHIVSPFLHRPSFIRMVNNLYSGHEQSAANMFQITMVLAISAIICSRRLRIPYSGEGMCATAMQKVDQVDFQDSLQGVHCLLLVQMFTSYSSFLGANPWYLNYQCLAAVLDLGLQRDVPTSSSCSVFERELRTRTFWSIYAIDRNLATKLGRPIGLRDEGCELRMPAELEDDDLDPSLTSLSTQSRVTPGPAACARVLFKLALLNSEIKYVLHSISRDVPRYTYPQIPDVQAWQLDLFDRLQELQAQLPQFTEADAYLTTICQVRYLEVVMLLFRPSPRFRKPSKLALLECHQSAEAQIRLFKQMYDSDQMAYSWLSIHSVCLTAITLLYCVWSEPAIAATTKVDQLMDSMRAASNLLSAAGEHWPEARRSRDNLEQLASATVRWLLDFHTTQRPPTGYGQQHVAGVDPLRPPLAAVASQLPDLGDSFDWDFPSIDSYLENDSLAMFVGAPNPLTADFSLTVDGMFSDYQPTFDFRL